jgi:hypothetical protein
MRREDKVGERRGENMSESALMLIPLLLTFLSVLQLPISLFERVQANAVNSGYANTMQIMQNDQKLGVTPDLASMSGGGQSTGNSSPTGSDAAGTNAGASGSNAGNFKSSSSGLSPTGAPHDQIINLGGGGIATISSISWKSPSITPLLPNGDLFTTQAISVDR